MSDDKRQDDDEDLMSDFKDLFPDDETESAASAAETAQPASEGSEALDELDALLDDFEQNFDPAAEETSVGNETGASAAGEERGAAEAEAEEAPLLTEEVSATELAEPGLSGEERQLELDKDDLDLAMAEAGGDEVFDDSWGAAEEEAEAEAEAAAAEAEPPTNPEPEAEAVSEAGPVEQAEEATRDDSLAEVAAIAAGTAAAAPHQAGTPSAISKGLLWAVIAVVLVSLALSASAAWLAFSASARIEQLGRNNGVLQEGTTTRDDASAMRALRTELRTLAARVNELAVIIEGPMSHLRESNEGTLADIEQRLRKLEAGGPVAAAGNARPAAKTPEQKPDVAVAAEKSEQKGGWAINLISLSDEQDADTELKRLRNLGVRAEKQRAVKDGKVWYRLRVPGFSSYEGAKAYVDTVEKKAGLKNAWVAKE